MFWVVWVLDEMTWGNPMLHRQIWEHELSQPGSPLLIGPEPCTSMQPSFKLFDKSPSWSNCGFCQRDWAHFTRELWHESVRLNKSLMENLIANHATPDCSNCACAAKKKIIKKYEWMPSERIGKEWGLTLTLHPVTVNVSRYGRGTSGLKGHTRVSSSSLIKTGFTTCSVWFQTFHVFFFLSNF